MDSRLRGNDEVFAIRAMPDNMTAIRSLTIDPVTEIILIAGSLYLAGEVLARNDEVPV
jgi:folylpolyglutamate synthase/dihydropteroate synthase